MKKKVKVWKELEKEVEACDECGGSGIISEHKNATSPYYADGCFSIGPCLTCQGTGIKGGRVVVIN